MGGEVSLVSDIQMHTEWLAYFQLVGVQSFKQKRCSLFFFQRKEHDRNIFTKKYLILNMYIKYLSGLDYVINSHFKQKYVICFQI